MMHNGRKPLLVVDDEFCNRDMMSRRLRRAGYEVEVAEDGATALDIIHSKPVEMVLLDTMMPGMTGIDLLRLLRATHAPMELPVIMVTALTESDKIVEALSQGANDYITKPVDFPVMLARIRSQLVHKQEGDSLRQSEERYALAVEGSNDGLWDWDVPEGSVYYSPRWRAMLGLQATEGRSDLDEWLSKVHPEDRPRVESELRRNRTANAELNFEYRIQHTDGYHRWMMARGVAICSGSEVTRITGSQTDITRTKAFDPLTGLPNRLWFVERVGAAMGAPEKFGARNSALLFVDLDRFKLINDTLGHAAGDQILLATARRLEGTLKAQGFDQERTFAARLGGDEFVIFATGVSGPVEAKRVAEKVLYELRQPITADGRELFVSASIGVALMDSFYQTAADLLRDADTAMYKAKAAGRGRVTVFDAAMRQEALSRLELELDLRRAIERGEFVVYYQPKVEIRSRELTGLEALVRWNHPTRGIVPACDFIPVLEESGQIHEVGMWVLRQACSTMAEWTRSMENAKRLHMSVNLSPKQFHHEDLPGQVAAVLAETGLEPALLHLELTESVLIEDVAAAVRVIEKLRALNVGLEIDDFGTGYSSFSYLSNLPFDALKIDRCFVDHLKDSQRDVEVVRAMLAVAKSLGLDVTAEGVSSDQECDTLKAMGCQFGQGYFFGRPMPAEQIQHILMRGRSESPAGVEEPGVPSRC